MLPRKNWATQKNYIFSIVYLTECIPFRTAPNDFAGEHLFFKNHTEKSEKTAFFRKNSISIEKMALIS